MKSKGMPYRRKALAFLMMLAALLQALCVFPALAGSIEVKDIHDKKGRGIAGMEISLYRIGDYFQEEGRYSIAEEYSAYLNEENMAVFASASGNDLRNLALNLERVARTKALPAVRVKTDEKGTARFEELENGLYLLSYAARENFSSSPSLLSLPQSTVLSDGKKLLSYDLEISGKVEDKTPESTAPETKPSSTPGRTEDPGFPREESSSTGESSTPGSTESSTEPENSTPERPTPEYETDENGNVLGVGRLKKGKDGKLYDENGVVRGVWRSPQTGDSSLMAIYAVLSALAVTGLVGWLVLVFRKSRNKDED